MLLDAYVEIEREGVPLKLLYAAGIEKAMSYHEFRLELEARQTVDKLLRVDVRRARANEQNARLELRRSRERVAELEKAGAEHAATVEKYVKINKALEARIDELEEKSQGIGIEKDALDKSNAALGTAERLLTSLRHKADVSEQTARIALASHVNMRELISNAGTWFHEASALLDQLTAVFGGDGLREYETYCENTGRKRASLTPDMKRILNAVTQERVNAISRTNEPRSSVELSDEVSKLLKEASALRVPKAKSTDKGASSADKGASSADEGAKSTDKGANKAGRKLMNDAITKNRRGRRKNPIIELSDESNSSGGKSGWDKAERRDSSVPE